MAYKVDWLAGWSGKVLYELSQGLDAMAGDIKRQSQQNAPVLTGALRQDHRINKPDTFTREVEAGDNDVPYARRRHFENMAHPSTLRYMERAGEDVGRSPMDKYFKLGNSL